MEACTKLELVKKEPRLVRSMPRRTCTFPLEPRLMRSIGFISRISSISRLHPETHGCCRLLAFKILKSKAVFNCFVLLYLASNLWLI